MVISSLIIFSCSKKKDNTIPAQPTPEALDEKDHLKESVYSKRYPSDIIDELYEEALTNDPKLKMINNDIALLSEIKSDSMEAYRRYAQNNQSYWASADAYINQLSDSSLKHEMSALFKTLEMKINERTAKVDAANEVIRQRTQTLNDQLILMKLLVTQPMMSNYQTNEFPTVKTLEHVIMSYDSVISRTKLYTIIKK